MKLNKKLLVKLSLGLILGGVAGAAASLLYAHFGIT
jgi:gas vesicle protein